MFITIMSVTESDNVLEEKLFNTEQICTVENSHKIQIFDEEDNVTYFLTTLLTLKDLRQYYCLELKEDLIKRILNTN